MPCQGCIERRKYLRKKRKQALAAARGVTGHTIAKARKVFKKEGGGE